MSGPEGVSIMPHMNVNWIFVSILTVLIGIFLLLAASWGSRVQNESERKVCEDYATYVNC